MSSQENNGVRLSDNVSLNNSIGDHSSLKKMEENTVNLDELKFVSNGTDEPISVNSISSDIADSDKGHDDVKVVAAVNSRLIKPDEDHVDNQGAINAMNRRLVSMEGNDKPTKKPKVITSADTANLDNKAASSITVDETDPDSNQIKKRNYSIKPEVLVPLKTKDATQSISSVHELNDIAKSDALKPIVSVKDDQSPRLSVNLSRNSKAPVYIIAEESNESEQSVVYFDSEHSVKFLFPNSKKTSVSNEVTSLEEAYASGLIGYPYDSSKDITAIAHSGAKSAALLSNSQRNSLKHPKDTSKNNRLSKSSISNSLISPTIDLKPLNSTALRRHSEKEKRLSKASKSVSRKRRKSNFEYELKEVRFNHKKIAVSSVLFFLATAVLRAFNVFSTVLVFTEYGSNDPVNRCKLEFFSIISTYGFLSGYIVAIAALSLGVIGLFTMYYYFTIVKCFVKGFDEYKKFDEEDDKPSKLVFSLKFSYAKVNDLSTTGKLNFFQIALLINAVFGDLVQMILLAYVPKETTGLSLLQSIKFFNSAVLVIHILAFYVCRLFLWPMVLRDEHYTTKNFFQTANSIVALALFLLSILWFYDSINFDQISKGNLEGTANSVNNAISATQTEILLVQVERSIPKFAPITCYDCCDPSQSKFNTTTCVNSKPRCERNITSSADIVLGNFNVFINFAQSFGAIARSGIYSVSESTDPEISCSDNSSWTKILFEQACLHPPCKTIKQGSGNGTFYYLDEFNVDQWLSKNNGSLFEQYTNFGIMKNNTIIVNPLKDSNLIAMVTIRDRIYKKCYALPQSDPFSTPENNINGG